MRRPRLRVLLAALVAVVASAGAATPPAMADEQPPILRAWGLDWLERVRDDAWPQPPDRRPVICLLDTGVAISPDTPADDPAGPIVARLALDGGDGGPQGAAPDHLHGTEMAALMAAPRNGWGTVGLFPQARIVSVRVTDGAAIHITPLAALSGVRKCADWAEAAQTQVASVVLAESRYDDRVEEVSTWERLSSRWPIQVAPVLAASGNRTGAESIAPLAVSSLVAVGASDRAAGACSFSGPARASNLVWGPGCDSGSEYWPDGSSAATAALGAVVAAARAIGLTAPVGGWVKWLGGADPPRPDLGQRLALLFDGAIAPESAGDSGSPSRSVAAPADLLAANAPVPLGGSPQLRVEGASRPPARPAPRAVLWRPRVRAIKSGRFLAIRRMDRGGGRLIVSYRLGSRRVQRRLRRSSARLRLHGKPGKVEAWVESRTTPVRWRSLTRVVRLARR